jgi:predicted nucleic acid-binding protein
MKAIYLIIFLITVKSSYALQIKREYGNVTIYISQSHYTEEINKSLIIAKYAELMSNNYKYSNKIYLHFFEGQSEKVKINTLFYSKEDSKDNIGMNIFFQGSDFSVIGCLNIIENSIINYGNLKNVNNTVDQIYINLASRKVIDILQNKIYRPKDSEKLEKNIKTYTYYYLDNKYHFIEILNDTEKELITVDKVIDFYSFYNLLVIFTQKNELKILKFNEGVKSLKLEKTDTYYRPFIVNILGGNKIFIEFNPLSTQKNRVALYSLDDGIFVQNLDNIIKK